MSNIKYVKLEDVKSWFKVHAQQSNISVYSYIVACEALEDMDVKSLADSKVTGFDSAVEGAERTNVFLGNPTSFFGNQTRKYAPMFLKADGRNKEAEQKDLEELYSKIHKHNWINLYFHQILDNENGIKTLGDLCKLREEDVMSMYGIGKVTLGIIKEYLESHGLKLKGE